MSFKFSFFEEPAAASSTSASAPAPLPSPPPFTSVDCASIGCTLIAPPSAQSGPTITHSFPCSSVSLTLTLPSSSLTPSGALSDLQPGVYEGGSVVWQGSNDVGGYILKQHEGGKTSRSSDALFEGEKLHINNALEGVEGGGKVLELGCGHAVPSLLIAKLWDVHLTLIDYNISTISRNTWPNLMSNLPEGKLGKCAVYSGDWHGLPATATGYNVVIASETLYTPSKTRETVYLINRHLSSDANAIALVSGKRYYFGRELGGGTGMFEDIWRESGGFIKDRILFDDASDNVREILVCALGGGDAK